MGNGVPNAGTEKIIEPTTGNLICRLTLSSHNDLTREQSNDIRAAGLTAGGMSNVTAAYAAIKAEMNDIEAGRGVWLDHYTTGINNTETSLQRRAIVWLYVGQGEIPAPPQP